MATERVQIIVTEKGSATVAKNMQAVGTSARSAAGGVDALQTAMGGLLSAAAVGTLLTIADNFTNLQNRLRQVSDSTAELNSHMAATYQIAQNSRVAWDSLTSFYVRATEAGAQFGASQQDIVQFVDLFSQSVAASGASAESASAGMYQLAQAFSKGKLDGDEFRSVMENLPSVANVLTESLGVTKAALFDMAKAGQLTPQLMTEAFLKSDEAIRASFAKTIPTISQGYAVLKNAIMAFVGEASQSSGAANAVASSLIFLAKNINLVVIALTPLMAALAILGTKILVGAVVSGAVAFTGALISLGQALIGLIPLISSLTVALLTNPFIAVSAAVIIAGVVAFKDELIELGKAAKTAIDDLLALESVGFDFQKGEIKFDAKEGAAQLKAAGEDVASSIGKASKDFAADAEAIYKGMGNSLEEGAKVVRNAFTGEIRKVADSGAEFGDKAATELQAQAPEMGQAFGNAAGQTISAAGVTFGQKASAVIDSIMSRNFMMMQAIGEQMVRAISLENAKTAAEINKLNAEAQNERNQAAGLGGYAKSGSGGGAASGGGSGGTYSSGYSGGSGGGSGGVGGGTYNYGMGSGPSYSGNPADKGIGPSMTEDYRKEQEAKKATVNVTNVVTAQPEQLNTIVGRETIINIIKTDPAAFRQVLGSI